MKLNDEKDNSLETEFEGRQKQKKWEIFVST